MKAPSINLLGAFLRPIPRCAAQTRASSNGHNVTLLDKLHRRQKKALRQERLASIQRAESNPNLIQPPPPPPPSSPDVAASLLPSSSSDSDPTTSHSQHTPSSASLTSTTSILPYTIGRTQPGRQLPVYLDAKGGGTKHITRIRKATGNLAALKTDLTKALGLEGGMVNRRGEKVEGVSINRQTNHIIVRGWRGPEVRKWAESRGF